MDNSPIVERRALTVTDFCRTYSIGRTLANELMAAGAFEVRRCGRRVLIDAISAEAWFQSLPRTRRAAA